MAFLIAARDELGQVARDAWLGDPAPTDAEGERFGLWANGGRPTKVEVRRWVGKQMQVAAETKIRLNGSDIGNGNVLVDFTALTADMEERSRTEFAALLRSLGVPGGPNPVRPDAHPTDEINRLLADMTFTSQFRAVRLLHALVQSQGELPEVLAALVRGYAHLGLLAEHLWRPLHEVFKARALLYAQRIIGRHGQSPLGRWHRAYALALAGAHQSALDDLAVAGQNLASRPPWAALVDALVRYDLARLAPDQASEELRPLAWLLRYHAIEMANRDRCYHLPKLHTPIVLAATETLQALPECYRVYDGLCEFGGSRIRDGATATALASFGARLYDRLASWPDLPEEVRALAAQRQSVAAPQSTPPSDAELAAEFPLRAGLIDALKRSTAATSDRGDPSWNALRSLVEELSFVQIWRRASFEHSTPGLSAEPLVTLAAPLLRGHPYLPVLETYTRDVAKWRAAIERLRKVPDDGMEMQASMVAGLLESSHWDAAQRLFALMLNRKDSLAQDLAISFHILPASSYLRADARMLLAASPYSPLARALLLEIQWADFKDKADLWEREAGPHPAVPFVLGTRHATLKHTGQRCLKEAARLSHDYAASRALADLYAAQGKRDLWRANWEQFLTEPDDHKNHMVARREIAVVGRKEWSEATRYAQAAVDEGSGAALLVLAACYECQQDWPKADALYRAASERLPTGGLDWFKFCRRTGRGDLAAARQAAETQLRSLAPDPQGKDQISRLAFQLLDGKPEQARQICREASATTQNLYFALFDFLLADEAKDEAGRKAALQRAQDCAQNKSQTEIDGWDEKMQPLVALWAEDLAQEAKGHIDAGRMERARPSTEGAQTEYFYFVGKYLDLHGQPDLAIDCWKRSLASTLLMSNSCRTLAGAELLAHGIQPEAYCDLILSPVSSNASADAAR